MFSSPLFRRILLTHVLLVVIATVALSLVVSRRYREMIEHQFAQEMENAGLLLDDDALRFLENPHSNLAETTAPFAELAALRQYEISLYDATGQRLFSTDDSAKDTPETPVLSRYLLDDDRPVFLRHNTQPNGEVQEVLLRKIGISEQVRGYLQIAASRSTLEAEWQRLAGLTWGVTGGVCVLGALFTFLLVVRILVPVEELTRAAQAITEGKRNQHLAVHSTDEIGHLTVAFNMMSVELSRQIEELQQHGQRLRENSERLATVLGGMIEGVIAVDSHDRILFANEAAFRMIEFEGRRIIGRPYWEVVRNTDVQTVVRDVLAGQFQLKREIDVPRSQSRIAFIASRLPGEPCPGVVLVLHDVTELRRLEKVRSEFVSNVGHELKTPLAAIQACTETLSAGAMEDPVHAEHFLRQITDHADRLHKLIIDLMELAKIEAEEDVFQLEVIDIGIPIQEAIDEHYSIAQAKKIELSYHSTIDELPVFADPNGVRTIVNNLLDNALNYTPSGGRVFVEWVQEREEVVIRVTDSGIGIDRKHLERIFERFYRIDSARSRDAGGTGLGLAIVKHLCQLFAGSIQVHSEQGQGSTFIIRFPLHTALHQ